MCGQPHRMGTWSSSACRKLNCHFLKEFSLLIFIKRIFYIKKRLRFFFLITSHVRFDMWFFIWYDIYNNVLCILNYVPHKDKKWMLFVLYYSPRLWFLWMRWNWSTLSAYSSIWRTLTWCLYTKTTAKKRPWLTPYQWTCWTMLKTGSSECQDFIAKKITLDSWLLLLISWFLQQ